MMMWHHVWWCDTMCDDVTLDEAGPYDDVTPCMMMWHYVWWCDTRWSRCYVICVIVYQYINNIHMLYAE